jgi:ankyrin repeat protein
MAFVNDWDDAGLTQVHIAATKGDMLLALREQPWAIDQFDENGRPPIHLAVLSNNFEGLEQLIQAGADVNQQNFRNFTPLMASAMEGHWMMVQELLEHSECRRWIDSCSYDGMTALHYAIEELSCECVWLLLDAGASASKITSNHETCLHLLADSCNPSPQAALDIFNLLRTRGLNLEARDREGKTPILAVVWRGNDAVFNALTSVGASLDVIDSERRNILWFAACSQDYRIIDHLAKQNLENINPQLSRLDSGITALGCLSVYLTELYPMAFEPRHPSPDQQQTFIALYFNLLVRDLKRLMSTLEEVCSAAAERDAVAATALLDVLIKKNENSFRHDHAGWYRGLQVYVKDDKWDPLVEAINEEYDETSEKLRRAHIAKGKTFGEPEMREFFYA